MKINDQSIISSTPFLLKKVLAPYKQNCQYLQKAHVEFSNTLLAKGEFSIPESYYIADTGHFNAVEFNICYNQLGYYLLAECFQHKLLSDFLDWDIDNYFQHQLTNILIVEFSSSFQKQMNSQQFNGHIEIVDLFKKKNNLFIRTTCGFSHGQEDSSNGSILLAIVDRN